MSAPARCELVRQMVGHGLSERRALSVARMSASALRYAARRERIVALALAHWRYSVEMIELKFR